MNRTASLVVVRGALANLDKLAERQDLRTCEAQSRLVATLEKEDAMTPRPPKPEDERKSTTLAVRFNAAEVERLDRIGEELSKRTPGLSLNRSDAVRAAVNRGLEALEVELGFAKKKTAKK